MWNKYQYICQVITNADSAEKLEASALTESFPDESEQNRLLGGTISAHLNLGIDSFAYQIKTEERVIYQGKETMVYWLTVTDEEGFVQVIGVTIQQR